MKKCTKCGEQKPLSEYYKETKNKDGLKNQCKPCHKLANKIWNKNNIDFDLLRRYGITHEQKFKLIKEQNNSCAICKKELTSAGHVDHCHTTGMVRGILCQKCNTGLGLFSDNIQALTEAIKYLQKYAPQTP